MRYFILNSSGNVGKTTVSREVLYSFMENPKIIEIETVNASSAGYENLNLEKITDFSNFEEVYLKIIENESLIVDVGASNLGAFMDKLSEFAGVETLFDAFIIPTVGGDKVMTDTAKTILFLKNMGIANNQIKVVFNNADLISEFDLLIKQEKALDYKFDTDLFIPKSKLFGELGILRKTINEIYNEDINAYKDLILSAEPKEKLKLIKIDLANRMAVSIYPKLKAIYERLSGESAYNNLANKPSENNVCKASKPTKKEEVKETLVNDEDEEL
ncbi:hypothetical protein N5T78_10360 [Aliarcobacter cryaerophilus]|uniref:hypothetical protein n=1 Tax=Aliarcobacter cryaerophilus TaxID=28198 RepID=UPI0021B56A6F|nr:hypothetical protein [Aliarcobacter cryaerophilus]MCT7466984.1 hypothetical protein [Aliarcobacter cryaerophilus]